MSSKNVVDTPKPQKTKSQGGKSKGSAQKLALWHQRFGHVYNAMVINMHTNYTVEGLHLTSHTLPASTCKGCTMAKKPWKPFPKRRSTLRASQPGVFFHSDICGPMSHDSFGRFHYFVLFKDDNSGYHFVFCIKRKSEVLTCFKKFCSIVSQQTWKGVQKLRSDYGGEYTSHGFKKFLDDSHIQYNFTSPHIPEQNDGTERENRTIVESIWSMLLHKKLSLGFWAKTVQTATYVLNRIGSHTRGNKTPYELWTGSRPVVDHLKVFGSTAYAHIPKSLWKKLDLKSVRTIFVDYCTATKGYRLWDQKRWKIIISRDMIFDEFATPDKPTPEIFSGVFLFQHANTHLSADGCVASAPTLAPRYSVGTGNGPLPINSSSVPKAGATAASRDHP